MLFNSATIIFLFLYGATARGTALTSFKWRPQICLSRDVLFQFLTFNIYYLCPTALTQLSLLFPKGLFPIMLLSRILYCMPFSSTRWILPAHCSLFNIIIFDTLRSSCLCTSLVHGVLCAGLSDFSVRGPRGSIFPGKWCNSFAGSSGGKISLSSEHQIYIIFYVFFSFIGPWILLNVSIWNASRADSDFLAKHHISPAYNIWGTLLSQLGLET
jgi:hypothetical protein